MSTDHEPSFAELFQESAPLRRQRLTPGQQVAATVVRITGDWIFIDLGDKSEGAIAHHEFADPDGQLTIKEGDAVKVYFLSEKNQERLFTARMSGGALAGHLEEAAAAGVPVEGTVQGEIKGGYEIRLAGNIRAFCPYSQIDLRRADDPAAYLGQKLPFRITKYGEQGRNIVVSRRDLQEEERAAKKEELRRTLAVGQTVNGVISSVRDFGAFVDIGGLEGLIPASEIAWGRVEDIHSRLESGQQVTVTVHKLDWEHDRFSFSLKDTLPDPWEEINLRFPEGSSHQGRVARLTEFGAFVTLAEGIDGLLHISKLGRGRRLKHPREAVQEGDMIEVIIDSVDREKKRLSLSLTGGEEAAEASGGDQEGEATARTEKTGSGKLIRKKPATQNTAEAEDFRAHMSSAKKSAAPLGTFADLFSQAERKNK